MQESVEIPDRNLLGILRPPMVPPPAESTGRLIREAIDSPIGSPALDKLIGSKSNVVVVVDDIFRPTPTREILEVVYARLRALGVQDRSLTVVIGNGLHRLPTQEEKEIIVGSEILRRLPVLANNAWEKADYQQLGSTTSGTPVEVKTCLAQADLIITIGLIKSHSFAGFTGGAKSIIPAVSSKETVLSNHRFEFIEYPHGVLGDAETSLPRRDMEEAARKLPVFIVNVVINRDRQVLGAFAGDVVAAHRKGVELFKSSYQLEIPEQADVVILEGSYPASASLYFTLAGMAGIVSTRTPLVKKEGRVIVMSECSNGVGSDIAEELFARHGLPEKVLEHLRDSDPVEGQWAAQHLASYLLQTDIVLVTTGLTRAKSESLLMGYSPSVRQALDEAFAAWGENIKILVAKHADSLMATVSPSRAAHPAGR